MLEIDTRETDRPLTGLLDAPKEQLVLRATGPGSAEQIVRLAAPKSTIGAAVTCTVRVPHVDVHPIHCSILRGPRMTVVHRWAEDTLLNGEPFTDAPLQVGDRLSIGPVDFEVLSDVTRLTNSFDPELSPAERRRLERLEQFRQHERRRTRRLLAELRAARWDLTRWQADFARRDNVAQSSEAKTAMLEAALAESETRAAKDQRELAAQSADRESLIARLAAGETENDRLQCELNAARESFANERDGWQTDVASRSELLQSLEATIARLESALAERDACVADDQRALAALAADRESLATRLANSETENERLQGELNVACESIAIERDGWRGERAELSDVLEASRRQLETEQHQYGASQLQFALRLQEFETEQKQLHIRLQEALADAALEADTFRQQIADGDARNAVTRDQLAAEESRARQLAIELESERRGRETLVQENRASAEQLSTAVEHLQLAEFDRERLRRAAAEATRDADDAREKLAEAQAAATHFAAQVAEVQRQLSEARREETAATQQLDQAGAAYEALQTASEHTRRELELLLAAATSSSVVVAPGISPAEVDTLRQQVLDLDVRCDDTTRRLEATEAERHRLQLLVDQSAARDRKSAEVEQCARQAADEAARLRQLADELRCRVAELELEQAEWDQQRRQIECETPQSTLSPDVEAAETADVLDTAIAAELPPEFATSAESIVPSSTLSESVPVSAAEILARLGRSGVWRDDDADANVNAEQPVLTTPPSEAMTQVLPPPSPERPFAPALVSSPPPVSQSARDVIPRRERVVDDESIEDYMARLLHRVRGEQAAQTYRDSAARVDSFGAQPVVESVEAAPPAHGDVPEPDDSNFAPKALEYNPRAVPPEFKANLAAMREIANTSARSAIETHKKTGQRQTTKAKLLAAIGMAAASTAILAFSTAKLWQYVGAGTGFATTLLWVAQSLRFARTAKPAHETAEQSAQESRGESRADDGDSETHN